MGIARLFRPRSILSLVLIGFTLVVLPLVLALAMATVHVNRLAAQSRMSMVQAVEATHNSRLLISQIIAMERNVRQYLVVGNERLLDVYRDTHAEWQQTLERLAALDLEANQRNTLIRLREAEQALFDAFGAPGMPADPQAVAEFSWTLSLTRLFLNQSAQWVDREVVNLQAVADRATRMLNWTMAAAVPAVLILAGSFAALITAPLRRIARAIHRLGSEDFTTPVAVGGPQDIQELGERLDWLRRRLAELEGQKTRFLRHMSHELKTPLTSLREGAELLGDQVVGPLNPRQQEVSAIVRDNSLRLQRLIENLLNFNQMLTRSLALRLEPVNLAELVAGVVEAQRLAWKARDLKIVTEMIDLRLAADREKLVTIVDNLLSNAVKFSPRGGTVRLSLAAEDGLARLTVADSGPGFDPDDRARAFEPFYQGRAVADGHIKGSGLGLAIAQEYAAAHGGRVEIVAGEGGCVRLNLPLTRNS